MMTSSGSGEERTWTVGDLVYALTNVRGLPVALLREPCCGTMDGPTKRGGTALTARPTDTEE